MSELFDELNKILEGIMGLSVAQVELIGDIVRASIKKDKQIDVHIDTVAFLLGELKSNRKFSAALKEVNKEISEENDRHDEEMKQARILISHLNSYIPIAKKEKDELNATILEQKNRIQQLEKDLHRKITKKIKKKD